MLARNLKEPSFTQAPPVNRADISALELLVIQPSPFCNLNCDYCYIPSVERANTARMSFDVLEELFRKVFASSIVRAPFTIAWHAGEPTALPIAFYEQAFALAEKYNTHGVKITHAFQSNGTTINEEWCRFIKKHEVHLGLSIDGPAFLHDLNRKRRSGAGTHKRVVETVRLLHKEKIPFSVISVLTSRALEHPDEMFDFFLSEGIQNVGFNIEEVEGPHQASSMQLPDARRKFARFLDRFYDLSRVPGGLPKVFIREMDRLDDVFRGIKRGEISLNDFAQTRSQEANPFAILSFDYNGNFSTFSPELVGMKSAHYGDFSLGNIMTTSIDEAIDSVKFRLMWHDVRSGIEKCQASCSHFQFCGGGSASNKYYENGSFDSVETMACRLSKKLRIDVVKYKVGLETEAEIPTLLQHGPAPASGLIELPAHLQDFWWQEVAEALESEDQSVMREFSAQVGAFAKFKGLSAGESNEMRFLIRDPATELHATAGVNGAQSAILNLGDEEAEIVVQTNASAQSLKLGARTGYWLGSGEAAALPPRSTASDVEVFCLVQAAR